MDPSVNVIQEMTFMSFVRTLSRSWNLWVCRGRRTPRLDRTACSSCSWASRSPPLPESFFAYHPPPRQTHPWKGFKHTYKGNKQTNPNIRECQGSDNPGLTQIGKTRSLQWTLHKKDIRTLLYVSSGCSSHIKEQKHSATLGFFFALLLHYPSQKQGEPHGENVTRTQFCHKPQNSLKRPYPALSYFKLLLIAELS